MSVIACLMIIVAVFYIVDLFRHGYFSEVCKNFLNLVRLHKLLFMCVFIVILLEIKFIDFPVSNFCKIHFNQNLYSILDFCNSMGEGWFLGGIIFTLILIMDYLNKSKLAIVFRVSFTSLICSGILNTILKCLFNRERPGIAMQPGHFFHFFQTGATDFGQLIYASNSMPSGHTIAVVATITPLLIYFHKITIRFSLLFFALIICVARIYTLNHWLSDVTVAFILGAMIGIATFRANVNKLSAVDSVKLK